MQAPHTLRERIAFGETTDADAKRLTDAVLRLSIAITEACPAGHRGPNSIWVLRDRLVDVLFVDRGTWTGEW